MHQTLTLSGPRGLAAATLLLAMAISAAASGQCRVIDFEQFVNGTPITTNYPGVTFSNVTNVGGVPSYCHTPVILGSPPGGTSSPSRALTMRTVGCDEFNNNRRLRMVFDHLQNHVSFTLGNDTTVGNWTMIVRWYNNVGSQIGSRTVVVGNGIYHLVTIGSESGPNNIWRIDVDPTPSGTYAVIDDLRFGSDEPPLVRIDSPTYSTCHCGNTSLVIVGETCPVTDGTFAAERHEYRPVNAAPGTPWTHIFTFTSPFCGGGALFSWNTTNIPHGRYYYRVTVENTCGRSDSDITVVVVSHQFGTLQVTGPPVGATVCGKVDIVGTINGGGCGTCYTVEYRPAGGAGPWFPVDPANPQYCGAVINCRLATWDVDALGLADGEYVFKIEAVNDCGQSTLQIRNVFVNSSLCGCLGDLDNSGFVDGSDLLILLSNWGTCP